MPERVTLLDAVCGSCKAIMRREVMTPDRDAAPLKQAIIADGLIPVHYTSEPVIPIHHNADLQAAPFVAGAHKPNCPRA